MSAKCGEQRLGGPGSETAGETGLGPVGKPVTNRVGARPQAASLPAVEMVGDLGSGGSSSGSSGRSCC